MQAEDVIDLLLAVIRNQDKELHFLQSIDSNLRQLIELLGPSASGISILFSKSKGENMPLILPVGDTDNFYIFGTAPFLGALLGPGQTISVVSADPATVILTPDATPVPVRAVDASTAVPAGTPTMLSGVVSAPTPPAQPNVAITCTVTVLNSDGTTAETLTDTVTVSPTAATAIGDLFGVAAPVTSSTSTAAAVKTVAGPAAPLGATPRKV
jgi:hypothetical protein